MNMSVRVGIRSLRTNPMRTLLSTLGVVIGVGALVSILSIGDGVERLAREQIERTTDLQSIMITPRTSQILNGQSIALPEDELIRFEPAQLPQITYAVDGISSAALVAQSSIVARSTTGTTSRGAALIGAIVSGTPSKELEITAGRFLSDIEMAAAARVALISQNLADDLTIAVGDSVRLGTTNCAVVGITGSGNAARYQVIVPLATVTEIIPPHARRPVPSLMLTAATIEAVPAIREAAEAWLAGQYDDWDARVNVGTNEARVKQMQTAMMIFKLLMGAIAGISLIVGGIGIMNALLASVSERTREIGVRRATGARRRDILFQFLAESVTVTAAGSLLGLLLGIGVAAVVAMVMRARTEAVIYPELTWVTVVVAIGAAVVVGLSFGIYPAMRAARLEPADAVRHE